jgi:hypothetical protein
MMRTRTTSISGRRPPVLDARGRKAGSEQVGQHVNCEPRDHDRLDATLGAAGEERLERTAALGLGGWAPSADRGDG